MLIARQRGLTHSGPRRRDGIPPTLFTDEKDGEMTNPFNNANNNGNNNSNNNNVNVNNNLVLAN